MKKLKLLNAIYCEDARQEVSGKYILIGASAAAMNLSVVPAAIPVAIFMEVAPTSTENFEFHFRVVDEKFVTLIGGKMGIQFTALGNSALVLGPFPLMVQKAGKYNVQWSFDNKSWETIKELNLSTLPNQIKS